MRTWSTANVSHQRRCANGRSMLTARTSTPESFPTSSLKRFVWASQTGVSSEGTTLMMRTLPPVSRSVTGLSVVSTTVKLGAFSPGLISGPISVNGLPLRVTAPVRSMCDPPLPEKSLFYQVGQFFRFGNGQPARVILAHVGSGVPVHLVHL